MKHEGEGTELIHEWEFTSSKVKLHNVILPEKGGGRAVPQDHACKPKIKHCIRSNSSALSVSKT